MGSKVSDVLSRLKFEIANEGKLDIQECIAKLEKSREKKDMEIREEIKAQKILMVQRYITGMSKYSIENETWDKFEIKPGVKKAVERCRKWKPGFEFGLFLCGRPGLGKTHAAKAIINDHFEWNEFRFKLFRTSHFLDKMKQFDDPDYSYNAIMEEAYEPDGLVLDDFGEKKPTEFEQSVLFRVLDSRLEAKKPTFMTTNLTFKQITEQYHERITDRIKALMVVVEFKGESYRNNNFRNNLERLEAVKNPWDGFTDETSAKSSKDS